MPDRRETPRPHRKPKSHPKRRAPRKPDPEKVWAEGERIAKYLARAGVASRREAEALIAEGKVSVDGVTLRQPAVKVTGRELIKVNGKIIRPPQATRLWRYHKPSGLITTNQDPAGRRTIFEELPKSLPRTMTVGRLDLTTEGLLLLTNDGELARALELPDTGLTRTYRARAHGRPDEAALASLAEGITLDRVTYSPIIAQLEMQTGSNCWIHVELTEGKKREVRRALESIGLEVNRLIRTAYGPFELGAMKPGAVEEVPAEMLTPLLEKWLPGRTPSIEAANEDAPWKRGQKKSGSPKGRRPNRKTGKPRS